MWNLMLYAVTPNSGKIVFFAWKQILTQYNFSNNYSFKRVILKICSQ